MFYIKQLKILICTSIFFLLLVGCSTTKAVFNYSGGNYHSISDDKIINSALSKAIEKISNNLDPQNKILVVQVIDNPVNEYIADRLFEDLYNYGFIVGKSSNSLDPNNGSFDKFLIFYPTIYGTEHIETRPSTIGHIFFLFTPLFYHDDRKANVTIHCRLVDKKSMQIEWMEDFSGHSLIRIKNGKILNH